MEVVRAFETSVYSNETTRRHIPEDCRLHTCHRKNLKFVFGYFLANENSAP
jgi:hypothetical protein